MDFALNQDLLAALCDAVLEVSLAICVRQIDQVSDDVAVILTADNLGVQQSLIPPQMPFVRWSSRAPPGILT